MESLSPAAPSARAAGAHSPMLGGRLGALLRAGRRFRSEPRTEQKRPLRPTWTGEMALGEHTKPASGAPDPGAARLSSSRAPAARPAAAVARLLTRGSLSGRSPRVPSSGALNACAREGGCGPPAARGAPHSSPGAPRVRGGQARVYSGSGRREAEESLKRHGSAPRRLQISKMGQMHRREIRRGDGTKHGGEKLETGSGSQSSLCYRVSGALFSTSRGPRSIQATGSCGARGRGAARRPRRPPPTLSGGGFYLCVLCSSSPS